MEIAPFRNQTDWKLLQKKFAIRQPQRTSRGTIRIRGDSRLRGYHSDGGVVGQAKALIAAALLRCHGAKEDAPRGTHLGKRCLWA